MRKLIASLAAAALLAGGLTAPAAAQRGRDRDREEPRGDQASAREQMLAGRTLSSREIERRVVPQMRDKGQYLSFEYDGGASAYRLKFISNEGQVTWVDVDARTGRVLRISR